MHIRFDVPADPAYAVRVADVMSGLYLRKFRYIGLGLVVVGLVGLVVPLPNRDTGIGATPVFTMMIVVGVLSILFPLWMRYSSRRRATGLAVDGGYDITDDTIMMRSGTESRGIAWEGVSRVVETPDFWILYVGRIASTVVPRQLMAPHDEQTLRAFLVGRGSLPADGRTGRRV
ncbi:YcxB family protein [Dactylosporangium roseum]|uniref:YcxB family protein n=1 Tax=Dactylosporangium roseum TaxID=47989 RepID=A0ABY5ZF93_9ACTN|nr:YcxB family protein [Dactylosporangium roseum]UWZ40547.1 YcxB family protein [Dactylosporangium roseum]